MTQPKREQEKHEKKTNRHKYTLPNQKRKGQRVETRGKQA